MSKKNAVKSLQNAIPFKLHGLIERVLNANLVGFIKGSPGIGKSAIISSIAKMYNLLLIDIRLSGFDQTDIAGIPNFIDVTDSQGNVIGKRTTFIPNDVFPLKNMGDEKKLLKWNKDGTPKMVKDDQGKLVQDEYDGWVILLDEFTSATEAVQAACYQLILDRKVGNHELMDNVFILAAGNKDTDGAIASEIGTALKSRVVTIEADVEYEPWMDWANKNNIHHTITDYLRWKPEQLHNFDPRIDQLTFPCPRTWEMLSELIHDNGGVYDYITHTLAMGTVGKIAVEFKAFSDIYATLPDIKKIIADPANADMPTEPGHQYALSGVLGKSLGNSTIQSKEISSIITYAERMSEEMQVVCFQPALRSNFNLLVDPAMDKWIDKNQAMIATDF